MGGKFCRSNETFALPEDESFYGFGERFTKLNKLGLRVNGWLVNPWGAGHRRHPQGDPLPHEHGRLRHFRQHDLSQSMGYGQPFGVSSYTFLIDDPRLDFFIIYGPSLKEVLARYEEVTGWPAFPPKESFGVWFTDRPSRQGDEPRWRWRRSSGSWISPWITSRPWSAYKRAQSSRTSWPIARQMSAELGKMGIKIGLRVDPFLRMESEMAQEAKARGYVADPKGRFALRRDSRAGRPARPHPNKIENSLEAVERDDAWRAIATTKQTAVPACFRTSPIPPR